ncbi:hypothetical protein ABZ419_11440 [Streptomyces cinnamoneus]|uniref:hypothetical protein n=1 Tax=Streptomyces cinnamoneus TaxID=53446 RepID=UPI0033E5A79A
MTRRQKAAQRLTEGSAALAQRITGAACAKCRRSYRHDLTGWRAALDPIMWTLIFTGGAAGLAYRVVEAPGLLWVLTPAWCTAAWYTPSTTPPADAEEQTAPADAQATPEPASLATLETFSALVRELAQDGAGAHLSALAERLTRNPKDTSTVRALCRKLGVPVSPSVRQPGAPGRGVSTGVKVIDLPALPPTTAEPPAVAVVVAGQGTATGPATTTATPTVVRHDAGVTYPGAHHRVARRRGRVQHDH